MTTLNPADAEPQDSSSLREGLAERLMEIGQESARIDEPFLIDDDLYDETGAPK